MFDLLWILHAVFWGLFGVRFVVSALRRTRQGAGGGRGTGSPWTILLVVAHSAAMAVMYAGLLLATGPRSPVVPTQAQILLGASLLALATLLAAWSLGTLRSWRIDARVDEGHELCTRGPYARVRHPIYLALALVALGSAVWVPAPLVLIGAACTLVAGDVRARVEERILVAHFGGRYADYARATRRFLPAIY